MAVHTLCCGVPALLAVAGATLGVLAWASGPVWEIHHFVHGYEAEIVALSFALVVVGGILEWNRRAEHKGVPRLYALSVICFFANVSLIAAHRLPVL